MPPALKTSPTETDCLVIGAVCVISTGVETVAGASTDVVALCWLVSDFCARLVVPRVAHRHNVMLMAEYPNLICVSLMLYRITTCAHLVMIHIPSKIKLFRVSPLVRVKKTTEFLPLESQYRNCDSWYRNSRDWTLDSRRSN